MASGFSSNIVQSSRLSSSKISSRDRTLAVTMTAVNEAGQVCDRREVLARDFGVGVHLDVVFLADRDAELERVDRVEPETVAEQRRLAIDVIDADVLEIEDLNEQPFELLLQLLHRKGPPS